MLLLSDSRAPSNKTVPNAVACALRRLLFRQHIRRILPTAGELDRITVHRTSLRVPERAGTRNLRNLRPLSRRPETVGGLARAEGEGIAAAHLRGREIRRAASVYRPDTHPVCGTETATDRGRGLELFGAYGVKTRARARGLPARVQNAKLADARRSSKRSRVQDLAGEE